MTPLQFATFIEWANASDTKLVFKSAVVTPIFDKPSQMPMYSRRFSSNSANVSPF